MRWIGNALATSLTDDTVATWLQAQASIYVFMIALALWLMRFAIHFPGFSPPVSADQRTPDNRRAPGTVSPTPDGRDRAVLSPIGAPV